MKRRKPRKYKRYEWPIPDLMWHTDWHRIKASKLRGEWFISYIDDCSRKIMGYGVFKSANTKNSLLVLYRAICANKAVPVLLNSDRGSQFIPSKFDKKGKSPICVPRGTRKYGNPIYPIEKKTSSNQRQAGEIPRHTRQRIRRKI